LASVQWSERKGNNFDLGQRGVLHAGETKREGEADQVGDPSYAITEGIQKKMGDFY
jgi:hypothetical protein